MCPERATSAASSVLAIRPARPGWIIASKPFIIPFHSCAITKHHGAVKGIAGGKATMLHWKTGKVALLAAAALAGCSAASIVAATRALAQNTVKLELWSRQDPSGPLRAGNVVKAAERLNTELAAEG